MSLGTFLLSTALFTGLMFAQGPGQGRQKGGGPPAGNPNQERVAPDPARMAERRVTMLTRWLELTPDQVTHATTVFANATTASQAVLKGMQANRAELREAVKANNAAGIEQASSAIGTATTQLTAIEAKAEAAFYLALTADQKAKYDKRGGMGMGMGMGMGGGGPMGGRGFPRE
jgi:Spy/CpxP family protein refolding chaperone